MNFFKKIISLSPLGIILYLITLAICFLFFLQVDLWHTATSSYAYLNGHITDFYEYNKFYLVGNDYLPLIYLIYAIWNIPLHLLGFATYPELPNFFNPGLLTIPSLPIEIAWWKALAAMLYFGSVTMIFKITKLIKVNQTTQSSLISTLFATSPFVIFSVFIFSGYDVLSVFFTMLGFYYYLKKDIKRFIFFFSIAISFKYFAAIIFFPLVLMIEKRPLYIIKMLILGSLAVLFQLAFYWKSQTFREEIFSLALAKMQGHGVNENPIKLILKMSLVALYLSACIHIFRKKFESTIEWQKYAVFMSLFTYALMFLMTVWHPQWVIIATPFITLSYLFIHNKRLLSIFETIGMLAFVWYVVNTWDFNVDVSMMNRSILKDFLPQTLIINRDLMHGARNLFKYIFNLYLFAPLFLLIYETRKPEHIKFTTPSQTLIINRLIIGAGLIVIPSFICLFMPESWANHIKPDALIRLNRYLNGN